MVLASIFAKYSFKCSFELSITNGWLHPKVFCLHDIGETKAGSLKFKILTIELLSSAEFLATKKSKSFIFRSHANNWTTFGCKLVIFADVYYKFDIRFGWKVKVGSTRQLCSAQMGFF